MEPLAVALCSITPTQRRRFFWAAWWTGAPTFAPFRKPDASGGGAHSAEEALAQAERAAARSLVVGPSYWARAYKRTLRGEAPFTPRELEAARGARAAPAGSVERPTRASAWTLLGVEPGATLEELKRAYRQRALETHPDRGGDPERFRAVQRAYERLVQKIASGARPRRRGRD